MEPKKYEIGESLLVNIMKYLAAKPYNEVADALELLKRLPEVKTEPKPE